MRAGQSERGRLLSARRKRLSTASMSQFSMICVGFLLLWICLQCPQARLCTCTGPHRPAGHSRVAPPYRSQQLALCHTTIIMSSLFTNHEHVGQRMRRCNVSCSIRLIATITLLLLSCLASLCLAWLCNFLALRCYLPYRNRCDQCIEHQAVGCGMLRSG